MASRTGGNLFLVLSFTVWIIVMGVIVHMYYIEKRNPELEYFAPDIQFESGDRIYFGLSHDGRKVGYKSMAMVDNPGTLVYWENSAVKLNLAGMSREVFIQCAVSVDTTKVFSRNMDFTIQSGTHSYNCKGLVSGDSLIIDVKNSEIALWRKGVFIVPENITYPTALPYYMHRSETDTLTVSVFDPVIFSTYDVNIVRCGSEKLTIDNDSFDGIRYEMSFLDRKATMWLDSEGIPLRSSGAVFFAGELGNMTFERSRNRDVMLLPLEVELGNDILKNAVIVPDRKIPDPRNTQYMEIRLNGIRASNIDIGSANKRFISADPVIFGIHYLPLLGNNRRSDSYREAVEDTSIVGSSDYIQSTDARFVRTARSIAGTEADTLEVARLINRWVYGNMKAEAGLDIVRSTDVFRAMRGMSEEYTKLFTALTRSIGIPTQINSGLVYIDDSFRYHTWPSVFADGTWHDLDPFLGQDRADATHIALIRGDYDKLVELLRIMGRLSISVLDIR